MLSIASYKWTITTIITITIIITIPIPITIIITITIIINYCYYYYYYYYVIYSIKFWFGNVSNLKFSSPICFLLGDQRAEQNYNQ